MLLKLTTRRWTSALPLVAMVGTTVAFCCTLYGPRAQLCFLEMVRDEMMACTEPVTKGSSCLSRSNSTLLRRIYSFMRCPNSPPDPGPSTRDGPHLGMRHLSRAAAALSREPCHAPCMYARGHHHQRAANLSSCMLVTSGRAAARPLPSASKRGSGIKTWQCNSSALPVCLPAGTVLYLCSLFERDETLPPVLSFSMGSLGFLTPFDAADYDAILQMVFDTDVSPLHCTLRTRKRCEVVLDGELQVRMAACMGAHGCASPHRPEPQSQAHASSSLDALTGTHTRTHARMCAAAQADRAAGSQAHTFMHLWHSLAQAHAPRHTAGWLPATCSGVILPAQRAARATLCKWPLHCDDVKTCSCRACTSWP